MENYVVKSTIRKIPNSSQLILEIDELLKLSGQLSSSNEDLTLKEKNIFSQLGPVETKAFDHFLITPINLKNIEDEINTKYEDGIYLEDDEEISYPFLHTIRTTSHLTNPLSKKEANVNVPTITIGNVSSLAEKDISLQKEGVGLLAFDSDLEKNNGRKV